MGFRDVILRSDKRRGRLGKGRRDSRSALRLMRKLLEKQNEASTLN